MATLSYLNTPKSVKSCTPLKPSNSASISKVRVIVRVRPFLPHEISAKNGNPVSCTSVLDQDFESMEEVAVYLKDPETSRNECYQLDSFFGQEDDNVSQIFFKEVSPLIPGIFHGCNATVFAYGATGSGKTYTMQGTEEQPGLMPLSMSRILSICKSTGSTAHISYYEVYMDRCYDLLVAKAKEILILEDKDGQVHLRGLSQVPLNTMAEFQEVCTCGIQRRKVAHTGLNDVSSRSHGVLVISVSTPSIDGSEVAVSGKLNLIDLAGYFYTQFNWGRVQCLSGICDHTYVFEIEPGNEDNRRTYNEGIRLQESAKINQSLFALSNVIYALNNNKPRIPYRESKLTRILQDSLGGTNRALMVACLNPGEYQESVHTVSLAARSRHISNFVTSAHKQESPKVKVDMEAKLKAWLESKGKTKSSQRLVSFNSPSVKKTPSSISSARRFVAFNSSVKGRTAINRGAEHTKERAFTVAFRNLLDDEGAIDFCLESPQCGAKDNIIEDTEGGASVVAWESNNCLPVKALDDGESKPITSRTKDGSSGTNGIQNAVRSPLRKALYPVNINVNQKPLVELSSTETTLNGTCSTSIQKNGPPLDKFSTRSSTLKKCLVSEYIDFLNNASRDELLELKGIGEKMAEYIIDLRQESPLKSLSDLAKIGLSSKQVHNLFIKAARTLFEEKAEDSIESIPS